MKGQTIHDIHNIGTELKEIGSDLENYEAGEDLEGCIEDIKAALEYLKSVATEEHYISF